ncbi:uncharacterized protein LOC113212942 [Frankliniella occidentalis]|uniref:Uncharacterized protein LOC113212942 n=1 Tax=Frankliniella occidentalis TaxID=133901 RepID=A0A9C6U9Y4_FRAOC|nr:uncharacterized protein LOC113212942 [Frankliniella occidentalis]
MTACRWRGRFSRKRFEKCNRSYIKLGANCSCFCLLLQQLVTLGDASLPARLRHLQVAGGGQVEVRLLQKAFAHLQLLERATFSRLRRLLVRHHAFTNASSDGQGFSAGRGLLLEIEDCDAVVLETDAFLDVRAPLTALVARTGHVVVQGSALSWLRALSLVDVARLELHEHALALRDVHERAGPLASVLMQNVVLAEIPRHAFPSPLADILIVGSEIRAIRRDAFSALQMRAVRLLETSVHRLDGGAFSARTLILSLEIRGARLHQVSSGAVSSAVNNLTISNSKLYEVLGGAFNLTVAAVALRHSVLERVRSRGFALNKWNSMEVHNNTFAWLEPFAFQAPFRSAPGVDAYRFRFTDNVVTSALPRAFSFSGSEAAAAEDEWDEGAYDGDASAPPPFLPAEVRGNVFERACHCQMHAFLDELVSAPAPWLPWVPAGLLFNTSSCLVDKRQASCFDLPEGATAMPNYTAVVCTAGLAPCEVDEDINDIGDQSLGGANGGGLVDGSPGTTTYIEGGDSALNFEAGLQREKKVLAGIFVVVVASLALVLAVSGAAWLVRRGGSSRCSYTALCSRLRTLGMSETSGAGGGLVSASSARSISRLSVHEYERQHSHATGTGVTTLTLHEDDDDDAWIPCEDKATQTLPEELTQELLQTLREKLDDPDNYSEARDMIEHLYDLIKVEESCNTNHRSLSDLHEELDSYMDEEEADNGEHVYDVIRPQQRPSARPRGARGSRCTASVGTRAPSPDKLVGGRLGPGNGGAPQGNVYTQRLGVGHARPAANMLRSIGQSLASLHSVAAPAGVPATPHRPAPGVPAMLCDYAEPTDAKVHVYCELPPSHPPPGAPGAEPPTAPCSPVVCRMANRPLPSKPSK